MFIEKHNIQHLDVVAKLVVMDSLDEFGDAWEAFLKEVASKYDGATQLPFYCIKYSRADKLGVEMYAPVIRYDPTLNEGFQHYTYFEIGPLLGMRVMRGKEDTTLEALESIRKRLLEEGLVQTSPAFYISNVEGDTAYTDIMVVYRQRLDSD